MSLNNKAPCVAFITVIVNQSGLSEEKNKNLDVTRKDANFLIMIFLEKELWPFNGPGAL